MELGILGPLRVAGPGGEIHVAGAKRRALLVQAANIVNEEQPVGILYFSRNIDAWTTRAHNIDPGAWTSPLATLSYVGTWVDA